MAKETVDKILQTKLALSVRALRDGNPSRLSIYEAVKAINTTFTAPAQRRAISGAKAIECRGYREQDGVIGLYLVGYVPNDAVGIVPHTVEELSLLPPPEQADFLDGELIALISSETVIVCRLGLFENSLNTYVQLLGSGAGLNAEDAAFVFKNRTDIDKLRTIQNDGVACIKFDGVANAASAEHAAAEKPKPVVSRLIASVMEEVNALTHGEKVPARATENLKVEVYLKFDKRSGTEIDQAEITDVAEAIADADEGFEILTLKGQKIRPDDVLLNKKVRVRKYGKSVAFLEVFNEMLVYYRELTQPADTANED
ncbi:MULTISPECIES: hypothetical protein [unclassified Rhizobium]|uniref:hypothetical protein n=1 Tax=unclassified Rhizobium TaxID=2613769 RepID=UPI0006F40EB6|nr:MULTISPECIES: hypothetical protein [unclassified Rhizobium]KQV39188.1 hypothetical protein ASC86_23255 [Rhizobium sp. Root1212]KRD35162.1 hypothetical protein ASE37_21825 [Rhizobium sp. Root268]